MTEKRDTPEPSSLLAGNSRTSLPLYYWSVICGLTLGLSIAPAVVFLNEVDHRQGRTASSLLILVSFFGTLLVSSLPQRGYYEIRPFERDGRLYEWIGVRLFRFVVPMGDGVNWFVRLFQSDYRVIDKQSIAEFEKRTINAESFHLGCLLAIVPSAVYSVVLGWWTFAMLLTLPNIILHIYPILLQRYTRARIVRLRRATFDSPAVGLGQPGDSD